MEEQESIDTLARERQSSEEAEKEGEGPANETINPFDDTVMHANEEQRSEVRGHGVHDHSIASNQSIVVPDTPEYPQGCGDISSKGVGARRQPTQKQVGGDSENDRTGCDVNNGGLHKGVVGASGKQQGESKKQRTSCRSGSGMDNQNGDSAHNVKHTRTRNEWMDDIDDEDVVMATVSSQGSIVNGDGKTTNDSGARKDVSDDRGRTDMDSDSEYDGNSRRESRKGDKSDRKKLEKKRKRLSSGDDSHEMASRRKREGSRKTSEEDEAEKGKGNANTCEISDKSLSTLEKFRTKCKAKGWERTKEKKNKALSLIENNSKSSKNDKAENVPKVDTSQKDTSVHSKERESIRDVDELHRKEKQKGQRGSKDQSISISRRSSSLSTSSSPSPSSGGRPALSTLNKLKSFTFSPPPERGVKDKKVEKKSSSRTTENGLRGISAKNTEGKALTSKDLGKDDSAPVLSKSKGEFNASIFTTGDDLDSLDFDLDGSL